MIKKQVTVKRSTLMGFDSSDNENTEEQKTRKIKPSSLGNLKLNHIKMKKEELILNVCKFFKEERVDLEQEGTVTK